MFGIGDVGNGEVGEVDRGPNFRRMVAFVGLNPSIADEMEDDPTIRRCIGFAKAWGYDGLMMLNLFAFRATDPDDMKRAVDPIGPENDDCLRLAPSMFGQVVAAWGNDGGFRSRHYAIRGFIRPDQLFHLGLTKVGHPKHPLYLRSDTQPARWTAGI